jgi:hypothetical protein
VSSNLIVADPTVEAVAHAVADATTRVGEVEARIAGSDVRWPRSWSQSLNQDVMAFAERALGLA